MRELTVDLGERSYPIYIGDGIIEQITTFLTLRSMNSDAKLLIVTDDHVAPLYLDRVDRLLVDAGYKVGRVVVPAGEQSKSLEELERVITAALEAGLDRHSVIIALGGGVIGDLAGFAAASFMRGVRFVQIPTTILAHDSSVGGKVAVNHPLAKNMIGAFHQPEFVLFDTNLLKTLPIREVRAGLAEVVKHGFIWDADFAHWCEDHAEQLLALEPDILQTALFEGCKVKALVVSQDEREQGLRAILNLGHTIGHALEAVTGYGELLHGEAISIGMVGSARLAVKLGYAPSIYSDTKRILKRFGLPIRMPNGISTTAVLEALSHDKKFIADAITFIIPVELGKVEINRNVPAQWVREVVEQLKLEE